jgi:hypothetical protein
MYDPRALAARGTLSLLPSTVKFSLRRYLNIDLLRLSERVGQVAGVIHNVYHFKLNLDPS